MLLSSNVLFNSFLKLSFLPSSLVSATLIVCVWLLMHTRHLDLLPSCTNRARGYFALTATTCSLDTRELLVDMRIRDSDDVGRSWKAIL
mmetsp:Transcript_12392/g.21181  ORF Transcript_12392/g.21181 Transcript_12392/m.21181 type:complete len:89 (-) Transcript_12392:74-340(-)